jgi:preprotein translocase subunit SecG
MQWVMTLVIVVQMLAALAMIGLVLIQHGKGADMGASFGSGASGSLFGATGSANFLSRSTAVCAAIFFACTLALAYFSNLRGTPVESGSVLERAAPAASSPSAPALPSEQIPGAVPTTPAPAANTAPAAPASADAGAAPASGAAQIPAR